MNLFPLCSCHDCMDISNQCKELAIQDYIEKGKKALNQQHLDETLNWVKEALSLDPHHSDAALLYAKLLLFKKDYAQVDKIVSDILNRDPLHEEALLLKNDFSKRHQMQTTVTAIKNFIESSSLLGIELEEKITQQINDKMCQIRSEMKKIREVRTEDLSCLGERALNEGYQEKALDRVNQAIELSPSDTRALALRAKIHFLHREFSLADNLIAKVLNLDSLHVETLLLKANMYFKANKINEALDSLNLLLENHPLHSDALLLRAEIFIKLKNNMSALRDLKKITNKYSAAQYYALMGEITYQRGWSKASHYCVNEALKLDDSCSLALLLRAKITIESKEFTKPDLYAQTFSDLTKVLEIDLDNIEARKLLDFIEESQTLQNQMPIAISPFSITAAISNSNPPRYTYSPVSVPTNKSSKRKAENIENEVIDLTNPKKSKKSSDELAPIAISYRGHLNIKDGQGMVFDHMRFQAVTDFPTTTLLPQNQIISEKASTLFKEALRVQTKALKYGIKDENLIITPPTTQNCNNLGLLVIPGRARQTENEQLRLIHEYRVIREALNRGQPILAICAGAWRLYEQMFTWTKEPSKLNKEATTLAQDHGKKKTIIEVDDHGYGGGMIRLGESKQSVTHNVQIHKIKIQENSLLKTALKEAGDYMQVNSLHWKAVNKKRCPSQIVFSAISRRDSSITIHTRQKELMEPQEGTVEAFENMYGTGAPILGIQWHPEGYEKGPNNNLLKYMAMAGNAYAMKRQMLEEFKQRFTPLDF